MDTKETVCLCMIVKDEEECILSAINSALDLIDELIVIDTGSSDCTPQLALEAGAKLFPFRWAEDFSLARNFALKQASSDWILILDADEVLDTINSKTFCSLLSNREVEGYFIRIKSILDSTMRVSNDEVVRLFRNKQDYRFEGAIHEQIAPSILRTNQGRGLASSPITISHYGYLKEHLDSKDKFLRNTAILKQELRQNPDNPFWHYCLGLEYYQQSFVYEGLNHLNNALKRMTGQEGYFEDVLLNTALGYLHLGENRTIISFITKALSMYPNQGDFYYLLGLAHLQESHYSQGVMNLEKSLSVGSMTLATHGQINCLLGDTHQSSGDFPRAHDFYQRALASAPASIYPLRQFVSLIQKGYPIETFLKQILMLESWPSEALWRELLTKHRNSDLKFCLLFLLLTLYRTINATTLCRKELLNILLQLPDSSKKTLHQFHSDSEVKLGGIYLMLALKEIQFRMILLVNDLDNDYFKGIESLSSLTQIGIHVLSYLSDTSLDSIIP
ncbi:glycosyl transferase [Desulfosporosinus orientis DSM 765]|uniref:Glycosyl transferase n=1 Tax=Desulfosporosinus orientis (strain ATCC 19365 / DSM 765 / NCIMB 8382 / VKM B-1628 / Singapore I) TaxID=768706 RepID=G7W521_DESOD|nr:glycosyltransferase family 2 protein [Desulfosporosinus orientis]AET66037.1 glycosyl transferase [Desulfosporosinus orientis DSM 765]